jgi:hypothetical protein
VSYVAIGAGGPGASGPSYGGTVFILASPADENFPEGSFGLAATSWTADTWMAEVTGENYAGHLGRATAFGYADGDPFLLVSAPGEFSGTSTTAPGEVYLLDMADLVPSGGSGGASWNVGDAGTAACSMTGTGENDMAGFAVGTADFDGDGSDDLIVGAPTSDEGGVPDGGAVFVVRREECGASGELPTDATWTIYGTAAEAHVGWSLVAGDLGTGSPSLFVTSLDGGSASGGAVHRFDSLALGSQAITDSNASFEGVSSGEYAGYDLALGTNAGAPVLLIGSYYLDENGVAVGGGYLVNDPGSPTGTFSLADADLRLVGSLLEERTGEDVALGDLDSDGRAELLLSAIAGYGEESGAGAAYLVAGTSY